jgi:DNA-binding protein HU-beta
MNKSELIDAIAADAGITKAAAKLALESFLGNVGTTLKKGKNFTSRFRIMVSVC